MTAISGSRLKSALHRERRHFSISLAASGGFTLAHSVALNVGIKDCMPTLRQKVYGRFRGVP
jgi:hypothetical protein